MKLAKHSITTQKKAKQRVMDANGTADWARKHKQRAPQPPARDSAVAVAHVDRRKQAKPPTSNKIAQTDAEPAPIAVRGKAWEPLPGTTPVKLSDHREKLCRWPIGDPLEPGFAYCGQPSAEIHGTDKTHVYCQSHRLMSVRVV